jgi:hypothetical protein
MEVFALTGLGAMLGVPWVCVALTVVVENDSKDTAIEVIIMAAITCSNLLFSIYSPHI